MDNEGLRARLIDAGLGRVADDIMRLTKPSIRIDCRRADDEAALPLGGSKLGGAPDLPPGALWPTWQGISLLFIGQICLADIAPYDEEGDLPAFPRRSVPAKECPLHGDFAGPTPQGRGGVASADAGR